MRIVPQNCANQNNTKGNGSILREMKFANDCVKCFFLAQKCSAKKAIAQKYCEWKLFLRYGENPTEGGGGGKHHQIVICDIWLKTS